MLAPFARVGAGVILGHPERLNRSQSHDQSGNQGREIRELSYGKGPVVVLVVRARRQTC